MKRKSDSNKDLYNEIYNIFRHNEKLNDNCVMQILYLFIDQIDHNNYIDMIDSQSIKMFMLDDNHLQFNSGKKILTNYFNKKDNIIIMPLNNQNHWSVLIYISHYYQWYHFDSLLYHKNSDNDDDSQDINNDHSNKHYHCDFLIDFLSKLKSQNIFYFDGEKHNITHINTIEQENNWECGQYLLMYSKLIINFPFNKPYNIDHFQTYIENNINHLNESRRKLFVKEILKLIKKKTIK